MIDFTYLDGIEDLKHFSKIDEKTWYVQRDKNSSTRSFYVTLIPGGLCMSGDYDGVIVMPYTQSHLETIGWMANATTLSYFAEKVILGNHQHQTEEYDEEKARAELASTISMRFNLDETMDEWFKENMTSYMYDETELREKLALSEDCHPDSYPDDKFDKINKIVKQMQYGSLETEHDYYELVKELELECDFHDLWELDPREYTFQVKWQQHCLIWWARNVIDRFMEESFEVK